MRGNNIKSKIIAVVLVCALIVGFMPVSATNTNAATFKIKYITGKKRVMNVGSVYQISTNAKAVTYKSSKTAVASVDENGMVLAKKKGNAKISVTNKATGKKKILKITVKRIKGYTISVKSGSYSTTTGKKNIIIKAKKGYTVFYTTSDKFVKSKKIKSKKSKNITVTGTTTIKLYVMKNSKKVTVKKINKTRKTAANLFTYKYTVVKTNSEQGNLNNSNSISVPNAEPAETEDVNEAQWNEQDKTGADSEHLWDELNPVYVSFSDNGVLAEDKDGETAGGVELKNKILKISTPGTYVLKGTLSDGSIQVKSGEGEYTIILNGVNVTSSTTAALYATKKATKLTVTLASGTNNTLTGADNFTYEEGEDEPDAAFFVKKELVINGSGQLSVNSSGGDGIKCKDQLKIADGNITVNAADDGVTGKDCFAMCGGTLDITSIGDGIKTNLQTDTSLGYVDISGGKITINSQGDGIQADTTATFDNAEINITTTYNSNHDSFKGIKVGGEITTAVDSGLETDTTKTVLSGLVYIKGGTFVIETVEDGIHSKKDIVISGGNTKVTAYSDGIQAEYNLTINGSDTVVDVTTKKNSTYTFNTSYKGLKAGTSTTDGNITSEGTLLIQDGIINVDTTAAGITSGKNKGDDAVHCNNILQIDGGKCTVKAGDDAFHSDNKLVVNGGSLVATQSYEGIESYEVYLEGGTSDITSSDDGINAAGGNDSSGNAGGNNPWQNWGQQGSNSSSTGTIYIDGGVHVIKAEGDGVDSNGDIYQTGGEIYVYGPTSSGNGIIDYGDNGNKFEKSGGLFIGAGTSDMAVYPTCTSGAVCTYSVSGTANKACSFNDGTKTYTFTPAKTYKLVIISTPDMKSGTSYTLSYNGGTTISKTAVTTVSGNNSSSGGNNGTGGRPR